MQLRTKVFSGLYICRSKILYYRSPVIVLILGAALNDQSPEPRHDFWEGCAPQGRAHALAADVYGYPSHLIYLYKKEK